MLLFLPLTQNPAQRRPAIAKPTMAAALLTLLSAPALAQSSAKSSPHQWRVGIEAGIENDSTVVVDVIDNNSNNSSASHRLRGNIRYQYKASKKTKASLGLSLGRKEFQDTSDFDSETRVFSGNFSHKIKKLTVGVRGQIIDSTLAGDDFLEIEQISPYFSTFLSKKWFLSGSFRYADKTLVENDDRSSEAATYSTELYYFISGLNHYIQTGYAFKNEKANDRSFDYEQDQLRLSYHKKFDLFGLKSKFRLAWRWQERDFNTEETDSIGDFRQDFRQQWAASINTEFNDNWSLNLSLRRNNHNSNFAAAQYDQTVSNLSLKYQYE